MPVPEVNHKSILVVRRTHSCPSSQLCLQAAFQSAQPSSCSDSCWLLLQVLCTTLGVACMEPRSRGPCPHPHPVFLGEGSLTAGLMGEPWSRWLASQLRTRAFLGRRQGGLEGRSCSQQTNAGDPTGPGLEGGEFQQEPSGLVQGRRGSCTRVFS